MTTPIQERKLLVVDGHNLLFQMFYGMPARIVNIEGKAIQGTLGFVGALIRMIKITVPSHLVVLFDKEQENTRSELLPTYKANRIDYSSVPDEDSPFSQLADIYAALDFMGISHTECANAEADDVIAAYARTCCTDIAVVIASWDSDFFQLIRDNVSVLRYRGKGTTLCTPAWLQEKYNITPQQYADFKSLTGDAADNIQGAKKIGPKTAARLLHQFGTLNTLLQNIAKLERPAWQDSLFRSARQLQLNYQLIYLDGAASLPFPLERLAYQYNQITTTEVMKGIHLN